MPSATHKRDPIRVGSEREPRKRIPYHRNGPRVCMNSSTINRSHSPLRPKGVVLRLLAVIFLTLRILAHAAEISGTVLDSSNAVVPGAILTAIHQETNAQRRVTTSVQGVYVLPALAPGLYTIEGQAAGFQTAREVGVKVDVGQYARLDFTMKPGDVQQSVTVNAESALVKTDSATVSTVINRDFIENLPLNARSVQSPIALTPPAVL